MRKVKFTKIWFPNIDLEQELFVRRNIFQARFVVLNVLASNNRKLHALVRKHVKPRHLGTTFFEGFLFAVMRDMLDKEGQVDVEQLRCNIPLWVGDRGSPEFVAECLANYALLLSYHPTRKQVERAIELVTSPSLRTRH